MCCFFDSNNQIARKDQDLQKTCKNTNYSTCSSNQSKFEVFSLFHWCFAWLCPPLVQLCLIYAQGTQQSTKCGKHKQVLDKATLMALGLSGTAFGYNRFAKSVKFKMLSACSNQSTQLVVPSFRIFRFTCTTILGYNNTTCRIILLLNPRSTDGLVPEIDRSKMK